MDIPCGWDVGLGGLNVKVPGALSTVIFELCLGLPELQCQRSSRNGFQKWMQLIKKRTVAVLTVTWHDPIPHGGKGSRTWP